MDYILPVLPELLQTWVRNPLPPPSQWRFSAASCGTLKSLLDTVHDPKNKKRDHTTIKMYKYVRPKYVYIYIHYSILFQSHDHNFSIKTVTLCFTLSPTPCPRNKARSGQGLFTHLFAKRISSCCISFHTSSVLRCRLRLAAGFSDGNLCRTSSGSSPPGTSKSSSSLSESGKLAVAMVAMAQMWTLLDWILFCWTEFYTFFYLFLINTQWPNACLVKLHQFNHPKSSMWIARCLFDAAAYDAGHVIWFVYDQHPGANHLKWIHSSNGTLTWRYFGCAWS